MPKPPWTHTSPSFDAEVEALLSGRAPGSPPSAELHRVAEVVAALTAPATDDEMCGLDGTLHAYRARLGMSLPVQRRGRRRAALVAGLTAGLVATGGAAVAAAASGSLPGPVQDFAHNMVGAPAPPTHPQGKPSKTGRDNALSRATSQATHLCHAYLNSHRKNDNAFDHSVAFQRLINLAGGKSHVAAYCAAHPAASDEPEPSEGPKPSHGNGHGRPASPGAPGHRGGASATHPSAHSTPTTRPSTSHPAASVQPPRSSAPTSGAERSRGGD